MDDKPAEAPDISDKHSDRQSDKHSPSRSRSREKRHRSRSRERSRERRNDDSGIPASKCIGAFGLSKFTTERDLENMFGKYGVITKIDLVKDKLVNECKGFGFVYFDNLDDAIKAKEELNGKELVGRSIRTDFSKTERGHTPTPGRYLGAKPARSFRSDRGGPPPRVPRDRGDRGYDRSFDLPPPHDYERSRGRSRDRSPRGRSPQRDLPPFLKDEALRLKGMLAEYMEARERYLEKVAGYFGRDDRDRDRERYSRR